MMKKLPAPRYDALLIDADDTLFDFAAAEEFSLERACNVHGVAWREATLKLYRKINEAMWRRFESGGINHDELVTGRFIKFYEELELMGNSAEFGATYMDILSTAAHLLPGATELVQSVSAVMPVVIVTNGVAKTQYGRLNASPLARLVKGIIISSEVGAAKPDPRMIFAGMDAAGVHDPSRIIMVGDSLDNDVGAAKAAGIAACWLNPDMKPLHGKNVPDYQIRSLDELPAILGI